MEIHLKLHYRSFLIELNGNVKNQWLHCISLMIFMYRCIWLWKVLCKCVNQADVAADARTDYRQTCLIEGLKCKSAPWYPLQPLALSAPMFLKAYWIFRLKSLLFLCGWCHIPLIKSKKARAVSSYLHCVALIKAENSGWAFQHWESSQDAMRCDVSGSVCSSKTP